MSADQAENGKYSIDPFPEIPPALLNSADITRYAEAGYLVTTFDKSRLKSAAYTMKFLGTIYSWESEGDTLKETEELICPGKTYMLPKNSITYFFTQEEFLLPEYIAARINFRIPFVHKGMLLGTGPLVDAGFQGSLLIPLHNLTSNDYSIRGGDSVIWAEFTKLSPHKYWRKDYWNDRSTRPGELVEFLESKSNRAASEYLQKAEVTAKGGVQSAFKGALAILHDSAEAAKESAEAAKESASKASLETGKIARRFTLAGFGGVFVASVGVVALLVVTYQMSQSNNALATHIQDRLTDHSQDASPHSGVGTAYDVEGLRQELQRLTVRVRQLEDASAQTATVP